jgi:hypothetical protein
MKEEWMLPDCEGRTCRWLERKEYFNEVSNEICVSWNEHWTSTKKDNRGCYLIEVVN